MKNQATATPKAAPKAAPKKATSPRKTSQPKAIQAPVKSPAEKLSSLVLAADKNGRRAVAVKFAIACVLNAANMEKGTTQADAIALYAVPTTQTKDKARDKSPLFQAAKGYNRFYLKPVADARQYMTKFFEQVQKLDLNGNFATVADRLLDADIWGENGAPSTMKQCAEFINEFTPKSQTDNKEPKGSKSETADANGGGSEAAKTDASLAVAVGELLSKADDHAQALVNAQMEALRDAGLPVKHQAKVGEAMLALVAAYKSDLESQMSK